MGSGSERSLSQWLWQPAEVKAFLEIGEYGCLQSVQEIKTAGGRFFLFVGFEARSCGPWHMEPINLPAACKTSKTGLLEENPNRNGVSVPTPVPERVYSCLY